MPWRTTTTQGPRTPSGWRTNPGMRTTIFSSGSNQQTSSPTTNPVSFANYIPTTPNPGKPNPIPESPTSSVRELRVKTSQVSASLNEIQDTSGQPRVSQQEIPRIHPELNLLTEKYQRDNLTGNNSHQPQSSTKTLPEAPAAPKDCSDHMVRGERENGVYQVTPDSRNKTFQVFCDMESHGGGWTVIQLRQDGSVNFNRTWAEYRKGFGDLRTGEFWLGNDHIHLLTRHRDMILRVELEDFEGAREYAVYRIFRVASERLRYRLFAGGYSGTAGDALQFSKSYNHNNRYFTTPDRDHDRYPSGNCGAYYGSGWWFDACMAANLNGKYYVGKYKGVRNGIYWGTWHTISTENYLTNDRQSFKTVRMMIRPRNYTG
ncbi:hypothetical protein DPEC_G00165380 [Dallia pectoralis]|uniref:Uncharacterized protein n=1 Tax=Dallia pectoralis TaxID=75939 RepID=A0ACC2GHX8_DALPE|nr:hypothetical protein DPEC_G00165380 [Dallia pectoralis]